MRAISPHKKKRRNFARALRDRIRVADVKGNCGLNALPGREHCLMRYESKPGPMNHTIFERLLRPLGLTFPIPSEEALRVDLSPRQLILLALSGISSIHNAIAGDTEAHPGPVNVTASGAILAAEVDVPRMVEVTNNGEANVLILAGGTPYWFDGTEPHMVSFGIELRPGDYWFSPRPIKSAVNAVAKAGEQSSLTVVTY